jgi:membrane protein DedA with SNARE-associated domain
VPLERYTLLTLAGSAVWCFALAGIGWALGSSYERFHHDFGYVEILVVVAVVALAVYLVARRRRASRLGRRASPDSPR